MIRFTCYLYFNAEFLSLGNLKENINRSQRQNRLEVVEEISVLSIHENNSKTHFKLAHYEFNDVNHLSFAQL